MKTKIIKSTGLLLLLLLLTGVTPLWSQYDKDYYTVRGIVKDMQTRKVLEYANISIVGTNVGTIANVNGEFTLKIKNSFNAKSIEVSHIGYATNYLAVNGENMQDVTVYLSLKPILLDEINVNAFDPRALVEKAISKIGDNYSSESNLLTGFYRETIRKKRTYVTVSEAIVEIYKTPYGDGLDNDMLKNLQRTQAYKPQAGRYSFGKASWGAESLNIY